MDEADDPALVQGGEGIGQGGPGAFGGVAVPPPAPHEAPGQLETRPALRIGETDHPEERAGLLLLHRPHAGARELPVPQQEGQVPPGPAPVPRPSAAEIARHFWVRFQCGVVIDVTLAKRPQPQSFRLQSRDAEPIHTESPLSLNPG